MLLPTQSLLILRVLVLRLKAVTVLSVTLRSVAITLLHSIFCTLLDTSAVEMKNYEKLQKDIRDEASANLPPEKGEYKIRKRMNTYI